MFRSIPPIDRFVRFFSLPNCYSEIVRMGECGRSGAKLMGDLLELFWRYKTFPDHYQPCRLWEVPKKEWKFYYGSNYQSWQKAKLARRVQPPRNRILFDDKATCMRLCRKAGLATPRLLSVLGRDDDQRTAISLLLDDSPSGILFIKPRVGGGGRGIVIAERRDGDRLIRMREKTLPLDRFEPGESVLVLEVLAQDKRMAVFSPSSVNTVRLVTFFPKSGAPIVLAASMRCGVGESFVDNWSAGGVAVGVDRETGRLMKFAYDKKGRRYTSHPSTGTVFEGREIPIWDRILELSLRVQETFKDKSRLLGVDIAVRHDGEPVVIEVNWSPDLVFQEQTSGPLLNDPRTLRAFGEEGLLVNRLQKKIYKSLPAL